LKKKKRSLKSLNPLARGSAMAKRKTKKTISEQQLNSFKTQCSVGINS